MAYDLNSNAYFRQFPELEYPSLANDRQSIYDYNRVKNIFRRAVIRDDILNSYVAFEKYSIQGDERPDNVAETFYNNPSLDWVVLITNNITNIRDDWPMSNADLYNYLTEKYTEAQLSNIHHYETLKILDGQGRLIQPEGYTVDSTHSVTFLEGGVLKTESRIKSVSYLQHEISLNDEKREINILKPEYLSLFLRDNRQVMEYQPSQQYISSTLKKTENPRILSPR
jgi:hypothetical protein